MDKSSEEASLPWQPVTFSGVAQLALAGFSRFASVGIVVAALSAGAFVYFLFFAWEPIFRKAIGSLPVASRFESGRLFWEGASSVTLAANSFVSIIVNIGDSSSMDQTSDLQFEFRENELRIGALLGYLPLAYPEGWRLDLNRSHLQPWWGAWRPAVFLGLWATVMGVLTILWFVVAATVCWIPRLLAFFLDRPLSWRGAFKLAMAAQWTGTIAVALLIIGYGLAKITLARVLGGTALTALLPFLYLLAAPLRLPRSETQRAKNPFQKPASEESKEKTSTARAAEEP